MRRESGILLHITSLPSPYGIGTLGAAAFEFIDFLRAAGQSVWQILPVHPVGYGFSPYYASSAFAGNPHMIDLDVLAGEGLLTSGELSRLPRSTAADQVDFPAVFAAREPVLRSAFERFQTAPPPDYLSFCAREALWLDDYALYMALRGVFDDAPWHTWPEALRLRRPDAVARACAQNEEEMAFHRFLQYEFARQWDRLHAYASVRGVRIFGDIPIYVPLDSADVWSHPACFLLNRRHEPRFVSGCPPDSFNRDGQYWGNPLYAWRRMRRDGYAWWVARVRTAATRYDMIRIDHFRGLAHYWRISAKADTAARGKWVRGPGLSLLQAIRWAAPGTEFVAEDLGFLTPAVHRLRDRAGFAGMKVLEFAFDNPASRDDLPDFFPEYCVCYTGTHDNATLAQWVSELSPERDARGRAYFGIGRADDLARAMLEGGMFSPARLFIAGMQDYLRLGAEARMNVPGRMNARNWRWRVTKAQLSPALAAEIAALTEKSGRG